MTIDDNDEPSQRSVLHIDVTTDEMHSIKQKQKIIQKAKYTGIIIS